jgi:hypothetical protein
MSELVWDEDEELMIELKRMCAERGLSARTVLEMVRIELGRVGLERRDGVFQDIEVQLQESLEQSQRSTSSSTPARRREGAA